MLGEERTREIMDLVMDLSDAEHTEAVLIGNESSITRFSRSSIHQNLTTKNTILNIRIMDGKRSSYASTNRLDPISIKEAIKRARDLMRIQEDDPDLKGLPPKIQGRPIHTFFHTIKDYTPLKKANCISSIIAQGQAHGLTAFGSYLTELREIGVANTNGVEQYACLSLASLRVIMKRDGVSGYASCVSRDVNRIDPSHIAGLAIDKAIKGRNQIELSPGRYDVVLEEEATGTLIEMLGYLGFGAMAFQEGRSFMCGRIGERIVDEGVSIWDDGLDDMGLPIPFDFEGVPKRKVVLIEDGVAKGVVYDHYTASKEGRESTGHALPQPNTIGPLPLNLFMKEGRFTKEELIESIRYGLLVTRFHYTNVIDPIKTVITGMTRDGVFLIRDGRIEDRIRDMRFTESILDAFRRIDGISRERRLVMMDLTSSFVPCIKIRDFNFTGVKGF